MPATRKIVVNRCFGGFGLSDQAHELLGQSPSDREIPRDDPDLVLAVEKLGEESWGRHAELAVVEIPADVKWHIHEYDGSETIHENHRSW